MDKEWHKDNIKIKDSEIHKLVVNLDIPIIYIYTTNYDRWVEKAYEYHKKKYTKIVGVKDMVNIDSANTQIVKFHGKLDYYK